MARSPQSFAKRQRERAKQRKRQEKLAARLERNEEKRGLPSGAGAPVVDREDLDLWPEEENEDYDENAEKNEEERPR